MFEVFKLNDQLTSSNYFTVYELTSNLSETVNKFMETYKDKSPDFVEELKKYLSIGKDGELFVYSNQPEYLGLGTKNERVIFECYKLELNQTYEPVRLESKNGKVIVVKDGKWLKSYKLINPLNNEELMSFQGPETLFHSSGFVKCLVDANCTLAEYSIHSSYRNLLDNHPKSDTDVYPERYFTEAVIDDMLRHIERVNFDDEAVKYFFDGYYLPYELTPEVVDLINSKCSFVKCKDCGKIYPVTEDLKSWYTSRNLSVPKRCSLCRIGRKYKLN